MRRVRLLAALALVVASPPAGAAPRGDDGTTLDGRHGGRDVLDRRAGVILPPPTHEERFMTPR